MSTAVQKEFSKIDSDRRIGTIALTATILLAMAMVAAPMAQAQTFSVLHTFTGSADGATPYGSLLLDQQGNLYGTAEAGGFTGNNCTSRGCGTVFKLTHRGSSWTFSPLYSFQGNSDGATPVSGVSIGPNGTLYGTTYFGGFGEGTVYNLRPPARAVGNILGGWSETVIHNFGSGHNDGANPGLGSVLFDPAGNMYGTTSAGGILCDFDGDTCGTVFVLTPSGGGWTVSTFPFSGGSDGGNPLSGVVRDSAGNLYGVTDFLVFAPVAYELTPSGQGWTETPLYTFGPSDMYAGVIFDGAGGLYGATVDSTIYRLSPGGGSWNYSLLYSFSGSSGIWGTLVRDASGNLYGATCGDGTHGQGSVFKLTPSGGGWTETDLYDFTGGSDGSCPIGGVARDAAGNIYGTTASGGTGCGGSGCGVVWEITP